MCDEEYRREERSNGRVPVNKRLDGPSDAKELVAPAEDAVAEYRADRVGPDVSARMNGGGDSVRAGACRRAAKNRFAVLVYDNTKASTL